MRKLVAVLMTLSLCACVNTAQKPTPLQPLTLSKAQISQVEQGVRDQLKDPDSAKFYNLTAGTAKDKPITVCGYVNAKNSFGGYTGKSPFVGALLINDKLFAVVGIGNSDSESYAVHRLCNEYGLPI